MSFVMGRSCFFQSPVYAPSLPSSSSSPSFVLLCSCKTNAGKKRQRKAAVGTLRRENGDCDDVCRRRAILFVGLSVLPFLPLRARALEEEDRDVTIEGGNEKKETLQSNGSPNQFLSLLNGLGVFSSGVLGALYALSRADKKAADATIQSMKDKIREKDAKIISVTKAFEGKLLNEQEERRKQLRKTQEEQNSLTSQLQSANDTITGLGKELQKEKRFIEELRVHIESLENSITKSAEDRKELELKLKEKLESIEASQEMISLLGSEIKEKEDSIQILRSLISQKDLEFGNLKLKYNKSEEELAEAKMKTAKLHDKLTRTEKELKSKNSELDDMNERVSLLMVERDDYCRRVDSLQENINDLKVSSEEKAALDAKLLGEKECELEQLQGKLQVSLSELKDSKVVIADLTKQKDDLRNMVDAEVKKMRNLEQELEITQQAVKTSQNEAFDLTKQLNQLKESYTDLESQFSNAQAEFSEAQESLRNSVSDSNARAQMLASELASAKEILKKTEDELQVVSNELASVVETRDSLHMELLDVSNKVKDSANDLNEERKVVGTLNKELEHLQKQNLKENETRKSVERDLEEATSALDEMNRNALVLSQELKAANSSISGLGEERDMLQKTLEDQKNFTQEARENLEDAHSMVMRLGKERESMETRAKKLEEELLAAKGEILRLRSQRSSPRTLVNDQSQQSNGETPKVATANTKKTNRRRKSSS